MEIFRKGRQGPLPRDPALGNHCVNCDAVIPEARLRLVPRTRRCVRCAANVQGRG